MKRTIAAALALLLCACLCACGSAAQEDTELVPISPVLDPVVAASESDAAAAVHEEPASPADTATPPPEPEDEANALYEQAQEYIGRPAAELFEAIGEPESSQYASSCEVDGGEDGMQFYEGFYVWTLRTEDEELVRAVYIDD